MAPATFYKKLENRVKKTRDKVVPVEEAMSFAESGLTLMIGGFLAHGTPELLIDKLVEKGVRDLTVIANDTGMPDKGIGKLVGKGQVRSCYVSHIGTNPETGRLLNSGKLEVNLVPQGTLVERIRCGGSGLGGVLTPTGLGTGIAEGKEILVIDGKEYLLDKPLRAQIAFLKAHKADKAGNLQYRGTSANLNPVMALAADLVVAQVDEVVEVGEIDPNRLHTPGILVDMLVVGGGGR